MPHFVVTAFDKEDALDIRKNTRPAHLEFLKQNKDKLVFIGPFLKDDGATMCGSLLVVDMADKAEVEAFCASDPYAKAGLFAKTEIRGFKPVDLSALP